MASFGGWTGKTLRVDLTNRKVTVEDTIERYKDYLGGTGVGYKVLWDEVPAGTQPYDEKNKIVFGVGPLTGTGAPSGGRVSITTIMPTVWPKPLVGTGHMGGHWGPELKFAGWDNIIIEGKADKPVWLSIVDDKVEIRDAGKMWGNGIYRATAEINQELGSDAFVAAIGQAGENMVANSVVMNSLSHSAGGVGGVMGSKNLKAIGVKGTGKVALAADKGKWQEYIKYILSFMAANNSHAVPSDPQPWAEYYAATRWNARKGLFWGAAEPPVETGVCDPHDMQSIGYRSMLSLYYLGPIAEKYTVRQGGCHSCPIRCMSHLNVPSVATKYGGSPYAANTCGGWAGRNFINTYPDGDRGLTALEAAVLGAQLADDYGVWNNYSLQQRTLVYVIEKGIVQQKLGKKEYDSIPWDKYHKGDPSFLYDIYRRIAYKEGELGTMLGVGEGYWAEKWNLGEEYYGDSEVAYWKMGHPKHHSSEDGYQVGVLINMMYNRDAQCHSHTNLLRNGLPVKEQKRIGEMLFGSGDAVDSTRSTTPMNVYKAKFAKWSVLRKELDDSLTLCNWMYPLVGSALKERNYLGDDECESKLYSLATGDEKSIEELDVAAERIFNLHRALTIRDMGTKEMRAVHDTAPSWVFDYPKTAKPFTPGNYKMDRADIELGKNLLYTELGWDGATGAPTRYTYERLGLKDVADGLERMGLL